MSCGRRNVRDCWLTRFEIKERDKGLEWPWSPLMPESQFHRSSSGSKLALLCLLQKLLATIMTDAVERAIGTYIATNRDEELVFIAQGSLEFISPEIILNARDQKSSRALRRYWHWSNHCGIT
jgi:hypothetical protein